MSDRPQVIEKQCKHPPARNFAWWAYNFKTGEKDILCVGCCECGEVLTVQEVQARVES